ncbi:MAG: DNA cytosine methyltransferase [Clostridia bacterium]|nr:DNA cytosine methyltransferase [Clostridia bacterium]
MLYSFFSGCGLLDLGMEEAGFNIAVVSEKYRPFLDAYEYSRKKMGLPAPRHGYLNSDICDFLQKKSIIDELMLKDKDEIIGFIGGPPCPDFSTAGKNKGVNGDNGKLSQKYFELIAKQKPNFFIFENVKGLWKTKKHRCFYDRMIKKMRNENYYVIDKLVNSLEYGVPQERERILTIGIKYNGNQQKKHIQDLVAKFNWGESGLNSIDIINNINWPITSPFSENKYLEEPKDIIKELTVQYWFEKNDVDRHANSNDYFKPRAGLKRMQTIEEGDVSRKSYKRLHRWRFSPTAAYGNNEVHLHPYKARRLSVAEVMAIQSVPKEFVLPASMTLTDKFKTIGNGVPVLMSRKLGVELHEMLNLYFNDGE